MTEGLLLDPPSEAILQNRFNLFALDVWQGSLEPGTPVVVWGMHHGANQRWRFESLGEGVFRLRAVHSGLYLQSPQVHPQTSLGATGDNPCTQEDWSGNTVVRWYLAVP
jgi:hypothetical protein